MDCVVHEVSKSQARLSNFHWLSYGISSNKYYLYYFTYNVHAQSLSCVQLFVTPWTVTHQVPLPMEFSRQGYWSGLPFPTPTYNVRDLQTVCFPFDILYIDFIL